MLCEFCDDKLENPVKLDCDHVYCEECALIIFRKDKELFTKKINQPKKRNINNGEAIDKDLKIVKDRDLSEDLIGKSLKNDIKIDDKEIKAKLESVMKGECIHCNFKLNGIFNKVDRLLNFLEKANSQKSKMTELKKRSIFI